MPWIFSQQPKLLQTEPCSPSPADTETALNKPVAVIPAPLFSKWRRGWKISSRQWSSLFSSFPFFVCIMCPGTFLNVEKRLVVTYLQTVITASLSCYNATEPFKLSFKWLTALLLWLLTLQFGSRPSHIVVVYSPSWKHCQSLKAVRE